MDLNVLIFSKIKLIILKKLIKNRADSFAVCITWKNIKKGFI